MDDEFALCWNNFQDNIATGFQNLYDRGDLVDVTIACDGKLLHAHKIVLAICSPYFQEMFITNPCKHPIIILKDVSYNVMCELLQFMYQGVVNVKHTELSSFMKIAQTLQVKGLATSSSSQQKSPSHHAQQSTSNNNNNNNNKNGGNGNNNNNNSNDNHNNSTENSGNNIIETKINSLPYTTTNNKNISSENLSSSSLSTIGGNGSGVMGSLKRSASEYFNSSLEGLSVYPKKQMKRFSIEPNSSDHDINNDSMDNMNSSSDDVFLPPIPQISMIESSGGSSTSGSMRNALPPPFNFEYGMYAAAANKSIEYPNDLHMSNDYPKGIGNHMDIPSGSNITMLSSTSLLHGNCIFNRNNTVATQQGMKTYWLCKSYRITMCRARCITHQGRVISATGVHNHPPHVKTPPNNDMLNSSLINSVSNNTNNNMLSPQATSNCLTGGVGGGVGGPSSSGLGGNMRLSQAANLSQHHYSGGSSQHQQHQQHLTQHHHHHISPSQSPTPQQLQSPHSQLHHVTTSSMQGGHHHHHHPHSAAAAANNAAVLQNMMQNVLSQNNLMHLTNMAPMLNSFPPQHPSQLSSNSNLHQPPPSSLQITPILTNSPTMNSPSNRSSSQSQSQMDSPNLQSNSMVESPQSSNHTNDGNSAAAAAAAAAATNSNQMQSVVSSSSIVSASETSPHHDDNTCSNGGGGRGGPTGGGQDGTQDSNHSPQTNIISSITISPPQNTFKMEHI